MGRRPVLSVIALAVAVIGSAPAASAAKKPTTTTTTLSPREARIRELRDLVGEASEQEAGLLNEVADIESRLDQLDDAVADLTKQSTAAQRRLAVAERTLRKAEADQDVALKRLGLAQAQVDASRQQMNQTVAAMYQRGTSEEQALYVALVEGLYELVLGRQADPWAEVWAQGIRQGTPVEEVVADILVLSSIFPGDLT